MRMLGRRARVQGVALAAAVAMVACGSAGPAWADRPAEGDTLAQKELRAATQEQAAFSDVVQELFTTMPERLVDFSWQGDRGVVVVTAAGAEAVREKVAAADVEILVETADAEAVPYQERSSVELATLRTLRSAGVDLVAARYVPSTDSVAVTVWTDDKAGDATVVRQALAGTGLTTAASPATSVEYRSAADAPREENTQGGEVYGGCTGGFVGNRSGAYGIITSAHCTTKPATYDGDTTGSTYVASNSRDVRFTALTGGVAENRFRYDFGSYRVITATGIVSSGSLLFKFGKTTGYGSSTVESYQGCVTFSSGNVWCNLYYTETKVTEGGDSGGPWFVANTGYAFTTGSNSGGTYITPIAWVSSISGGVTVKTS